MKNYLIATDHTVYDLELNDEKPNWELSFYPHGRKKGEKIRGEALPAPALNDAKKLHSVIESNIKKLNETLIAIYQYNEEQNKYEFQIRKKAVPGGTV